MSDALNTSISALNALFTQTDVTANNIANSQTNGFKESNVQFEDVDPSGVKVTISSVNTPGDTLPPDANGNPQESSNVNLAENLINLIVAQNSVAANIDAINAQNEMQQSIIDIKA
ncbi:MAG: flagellar basal body rod C-terminal domain-containing protein [Syntrophales bacterium]|jgi:flagellar hook protein FlgE